MAINNSTLFSIQNETKTSTLPSLDELLIQLDFQIWEIVINTFILPSINLLGICLCSFSLWIFFRPSFSDPIFFFYKLLCLVNIIHLIHNIFYGVLFTPFYFPWVNTYAVGVFQIYNALMSSLLFHYEDVLQMGILLHKMKLFSPFVRKHFTASPQLISLISFLACLVIEVPLIFVLKIVSLGDYYYVDSNGVKHYSTLFYPISSDFSQTLYGQILLFVFTFFINLFLSLVVGIALNIFSYLKYQRYTRQRQQAIDELQMSSIHNRPTLNRELEQMNERKIWERRKINMLYMALTLSSISILSRLTLISCFIFFFAYTPLSNSYVFYVINNLVNTLGPTVSIFVFYSFNQMFRDETNRKFRIWSA
jgi:hypothetical protein